MIDKAPIRFRPYLKTVIWGGNKICTYKEIRQEEPNVGESWEISAVPGHESVVVEGEYEGMNLVDLIGRFGAELLGESVSKRYHGSFPLLIKFIDANDNLSVQVHPDDDLARKRHGCLGKTEMWYIIGADRDAKIYAGLNRRISPEEYVKLVNDDKFQSVLAVHDAAPGDVFFLPAGRVHAIGAGNMLAEIQESSDITYRIYDYGRCDADGNTRELHTEQAKDAIDYNVYDNYKSAPAPADVPDYELANCGHFATRRILLDGHTDLKFDGSSFNVLICISGDVTIGYPGKGELSGSTRTCRLKSCETVLLPAALHAVTLSGHATLLLTHS